MANLDPALAKTLQSEGGYADVAGDTGGETYCGISRTNFPQSAIWPVIDRSQPLRYNEIIGGAEGPALAGLVADFYRTEFWNRMQGDSITSQSVADYLFDWYVNSGDIAIKKVQELLGLPADGCMGPETLHALNSANAQDLFNRMVQTRVQDARALAQARPADAQFLTGWLRRFEGFTFTT